MKYLGAISDAKDLVNKGYVDTNKVDKAGDTMTGNLSITAADTSERYVRAANSTGGVFLDITSDARHGLWSSVLSKWILMATSAGNIYINNACINSSGDLTIAGHASAIGTIKDAYLTANKTVANNTGTSLCSLSLEAGVWLVHAWLRFPSNATGSRIGNIGSSGAADWQASMTAVNGNVSQLHFTRILNPTSTTTYHLNAIQTSGANMTLLAGDANGFNAMRAVRIA